MCKYIRDMLGRMRSPVIKLDSRFFYCGLRKLTDKNRVHEHKTTRTRLLCIAQMLSAGYKLIFNSSRLIMFCKKYIINQSVFFVAPCYIDL